MSVIGRNTPKISQCKGIPKKSKFITKCENIFDGMYIYQPSDEISKKQYYDFSEFNVCVEDDIDSAEVLKTFKLYKKSNALAKTKVDPGIKTVYCKISYPLAKQVYIKVEYDRYITYGEVLEAYTLAYQYIYQKEDEDVSENEKEKTGENSFSMNRSSTDGRFGIWGHVIGDLVYNGNSVIKTYKTSKNEHFVVCQFGCDS